jgi:hypothetical protein
MQKGESALRRSRLSRSPLREVADYSFALERPRPGARTDSRWIVQQKITWAAGGVIRIRDLAAGRTGWAAELIGNGSVAVAAIRARRAIAAMSARRSALQTCLALRIEFLMAVTCLHRGALAGGGLFMTNWHYRATGLTGWRHLGRHDLAAGVHGRCFFGVAFDRCPALAIGTASWPAIARRARTIAATAATGSAMWAAVAASLTAAFVATAAVAAMMPQAVVEQATSTAGRQGQPSQQRKIKTLHGRWIPFPRFTRQRQRRGQKRSGAYPPELVLAKALLQTDRSSVGRIGDTTGEIQQIGRSAISGKVGT